MQYSTDASSLSMSATGESNSYYAPTVTHHVVLPGPLKPATTYYYRCGDAAGGWSDVLSFVSAPESSAGVTVMVIGDQGLYNSNDTMRLMMERGKDVDFLMHGTLGFVLQCCDPFVPDQSLALAPCSRRHQLRGRRVPAQPNQIWLRADVEHLHAEHPATCVSDPDDDHAREVSGNLVMLSHRLNSREVLSATSSHESECHSPICALSKTKKAAFGNFSAYNHRFRMPISPSESNSGTNMWSSYNYGPVHFVSLDTETDVSRAAPIMPPPCSHAPEVANAVPGRPVGPVRLQVRRLWAAAGVAGG